MKQIKISVIIPVYNAAPYLEEMFESLKRQTFQDFEVIIVNDGSVDNSQEILNEYQQEGKLNIQCYYQENKGQSAARNYALRYAKAEYIAYIDADDRFEDTYLQVLYETAEKEKADIVFCGYRKYISDTNKEIYRRMPGAWNEKFAEGVTHVFSYGPWAKIYRTSLLKDYNIEFSEGEQLEDGPYCMTTHLLAKKIVTLDWIGYHYRVYADSTMGNVRKVKSKPRVPYRGVEMAINKVREYNQEPVKDHVLEFCTLKILAGLVTSMYCNADNETRKEVCSYCYRLIDKYFPNATRNPYIGIFKLKKLPVAHRVAVWMFVWAYRLKLIYPFSVIVAGVYRCFSR